MVKDKWDYTKVPNTVGLYKAVHIHTKEIRYAGKFRFPDSTKMYNKFLTSKTKKEAIKEIESIKEEYTASKETYNTKKDHYTLNTLMTEYFMSRGKAYHNQLITYNKYFKQDLGLRKIKYFDITLIHQFYNLIKHLSQSVITHQRQALQTVYKEATGRYLPTHKDITWKTTQTLKPTLQTFLGIHSHEWLAKRLYTAISKIKNDNHRLILLFALMTGKRVAEISQLKLEYFNLDKGYVEIPFSLTKTKKEYLHTLPLSNEIIELLKKTKPIHPETGFIALDKKTQNYSARFKRLLAKALGKDIKDIKGLGIHQTRHILVSTLLAHDVDSYLLDKIIDHSKKGQSSLASYGQLNYEKHKELLEKYESILKSL